MASLLNMSGGSLLSKGLPYDAEIEYLESTGTQWINTGVYLNKNISLALKMETSSRNIYECSVFGYRDSANLNNFAVHFGNINTIYIIADFNNSMYYTYRAQTVVSQGTQYDIIISKTLRQINNTKNSTFCSDSINCNLPAYLFRISGNPNVDRVFNGKIFYCTLKDNDTFILDLIPVRVGNVGYMYDKISGQLFGNQGTGSFIVGPDKTN